jgi:hypothetical protein
MPAKNVDPDSLNRDLDTDPAFHLKNCNLRIPMPSLKTSKPQEKHSAHRREHPALQKMKFINFSIFLVLFALLDPVSDP